MGIRVISLYEARELTNRGKENELRALEEKYSNDVETINSKISIACAEGRYDTTIEFISAYADITLQNLAKIYEKHGYHISWSKSRETLNPIMIIDWNELNTAK